MRSGEDGTQRRGTLSKQYFHSATEPTAVRCAAGRQLRCAILFPPERNTPCTAPPPPPPPAPNPPPPKTPTWRMRSSSLSANTHRAPHAPLPPSLLLRVQHGLLLEGCGRAGGGGGDGEGGDSNARIRELTRVARA